MNPSNGELRGHKRRTDFQPSPSKRRILNPDSPVTSTQDAYQFPSFYGQDLPLRVVGQVEGPSYVANSSFYPQQTPSYSSESHRTHIPAVTSNHQRRSIGGTDDNYQSRQCDQTSVAAYPPFQQLPMTTPYPALHPAVYGRHLATDTCVGAKVAGPSTLASNYDEALGAGSMEQLILYGNPAAPVPKEWCASTRSWNIKGPETAAQAWRSLFPDLDDAPQDTQSVQSDSLSFLEPSKAGGIRYVDKNESLLIMSLQRELAGPRLSLRLLHSLKSKLDDPSEEFARCQELETKVDDLLSENTQFLLTYGQRCRERARHDHTAPSQTLRFDPKSMLNSAIIAKEDDRSLAMIASVFSWVFPCRPVLDPELDGRMRSGEVSHQYIPPSGFMDARASDLKNLMKISTGELPNPELTPWAIGKFEM